MSFSISWSFPLGQHNFLLLRKSDSLSLSSAHSAHLESSCDILLAFDHFIVIRHLSLSLSCLQIWFPPLLSCGLPAALLMLLFFPLTFLSQIGVHTFTSVHVQVIFLLLSSLRLICKLCVSHKPYTHPLPSHLLLKQYALAGERCPSPFGHQIP